MPETDPIKNILRLFHYGLFVATSVGPEGPRAATISWVTQVSFEPKLLAVALRRGTAICEAVQASRRFGLHVVGAQQAEMARSFFKVAPASANEIAGYPFALSERGVPILGGAAAWLECEVIEEASQTGDHAVLIARLVDGALNMPGVAALALRDTMWHYGG